MLNNKCFRAHNLTLYSERSHLEVYVGTFSHESENQTHPLKFQSLVTASNNTPACERGTKC